MAYKITRSIFDLIELTHPGLEGVKIAVEAEDFKEASKKLKEHYDRRQQPVLFMVAENKAELLQHVKNKHKEDLEEVIKVAEEVSKDTFLFSFPWDMEKTNIPITFDKEILWSHIPAGDEEWAFMLNRHRYWVALGQAYYVTGNEEYAKTFVKQLEHWIDCNPADGQYAPITWRSIEAGIRCENWIKSYEYFKGSPAFTAELFVKMLQCLHDHCEYLSSRFDQFRHISNWGVLENHGLFEAAIFLSEFKKSKEWKEESASRLKRCIQLQIMRDGVHWEQSPMYHNEVFHCFMDVLLIARRNDIQLDPCIEEKTKAMGYANLYMAKPNHHQTLQSDSDDTDVRDLITEAAMLFRDGTLKFGGYKTLDFNSIWLFGLEGAKEYEKIPCNIPEKLSIALEDSGNYIMRNSWEEEDLYLHFDCGSIGGGHGHVDLLHVDIQGYGNDLVSDTGRYTYVEGDPLREYFKSCKAHNTMVVDGIEFTKCRGSWGYEKVANPCDVKWVSAKEFDYVQGSHTGYRDLKDPVHPLRRIIFVKPNYWILIDSFDCKEKHIFTEYFHFLPGKVELDTETKECSTCFTKGGNLRIIPVKTEQIEGKIEEGLYSSEYNLKEKNKVLSYGQENSGFTSFIHILYPEKEGKESKVTVKNVEVYGQSGFIPPSFAEAFKIIFEESKEEHILFIRHNKNYRAEASSISNLFSVDGTYVRGEVVLVKRKENKEEVIVIQ